MRLNCVIVRGPKRPNYLKGVLMKRTTALLAAILFVPALTLLADNNNSHGSRGRGNGGGSSSGRSSAPARQPVVINMSRPASGGHNRNFPSQQSAPQPATHAQPSYGRLNWTAPASNANHNFNQGTRPGQSPITTNFRPNAKAYSSPGLRASVAIHHHPYTQGYVRKKLQKIGVTREPSLITDRSQIIHTSRQFSTIRYPGVGPDRLSINATIVSPRHFNDPVVRDHMALVDTADWHDRIAGFDNSEIERNHYFWHTDSSFNYCHYIDGQGYHWWGWYVGSQFFWNRYYAGRWWWYDSDFDRWCFWNEGYWWWQDPYHVGDLYCYNDDSYIPCNSAEDQVVVTSPDDAQFQVYNSPDGTRQVKIVSGTQDAFLYDTANPPNFQPVYLASGVESVSFSDPNSGRPLEIVLKLNDGTFDMFDANGNSYGPGNYDADQATMGGAESDNTNNPPPDGTTAPPADNNPAPPADNGQSGT
jgi:hypothetical protein